jgi:hypothetical protein
MWLVYYVERRLGFHIESYKTCFMFPFSGRLHVVVRNYKEYVYSATIRSCSLRY